MTAKVRKGILDAADRLTKYPRGGQVEEYLAHLGLEHRRVIYSQYKIIYRIVGDTIFITDIFDSRQDPEKMSD